MFWKKKKQEEEHKQESTIILGMVMLSDESSFSLDAFAADYNNHYSTTIEDVKGNSEATAFSLEGEMIAIGHMPLPIPAGDLESAASYAYNWVNALEEVKEHKSHLIVSVMAGSADALQRFRLFTQVVCSLLRTTNAIGVYMGNQSLLIPREDYLNEAALMNEDSLPLNLWIYFGLRESDRGNSGFTYGLKEFGKSELEVLNSFQHLEEIRTFLYNIAHYVLDYDITFKDGQTCGMSEEERIAITFSKGSQLEGETFKLAY